MSLGSCGVDQGDTLTGSWEHSIPGSIHSNRDMGWVDRKLRTRNGFLLYQHSCLSHRWGVGRLFQSTREAGVAAFRFHLRSRCLKCLVVGGPTTVLLPLTLTL